MKTRVDPLAGSFVSPGVPALAAYDSGNLLAVAKSIRDHWPEKRIIIAGDDDHRIQKNVPFFADLRQTIGLYIGRATSVGAKCNNDIVIWELGFKVSLCQPQIIPLYFS